MSALSCSNVVHLLINNPTVKFHDYDSLEYEINHQIKHGVQSQS